MKLGVGLHEAHEGEEVFLPFAGAASGVALRVGAPRECQIFTRQHPVDARPEVGHFPAHEHAC
jgi:hypothetical protein